MKKIRGKGIEQYFKCGYKPIRGKKDPLGAGREWREIMHKAEMSFYGKCKLDKTGNRTNIPRPRPIRTHT